MKPIKRQHEINEELESRSGVSGLTVIRSKGNEPSWSLGGIREPPIDEAAEARLQKVLAELQREWDIA